MSPLRGRTPWRCDEFRSPIVQHFLPCLRKASVPCDCGSHPAPCLANQECFWGQSKYLPRGRDSVRFHKSSWKWPFWEGLCSGESSCSENVSYFSVEIKAMTFTLSCQMGDGSDASLTASSSVQFNKLLFS